MNSLLRKILCHLQSDKSGSDYRAASRLLCLDIIINSISIRNISQGKYMVFLYTRYCRTNGCCPRRKHQLVIGFFICLISMANQYSLIGTVDRQNLTFCPYIYAESLMKPLRCLQLQRSLICNHPSYIIGQTAVGIRNILSTFHHNNLCTLIISSKTSGCSCASCYTPDNYYLHK